MISKFQKLVNFLYKQFVKEMGREPATPKEIMDIQNEAVQYFNKTKGVPQGAPKPPFQGFTPKVIEGGKSKKGIESLLETGDVKVGVAPKTPQSRIDWYKKAAQKQRYSDDFYKGPSISKEQWIAKKKAENKAAVKRLKEKKKTVEDFSDDGDFDPGGMASGS